MFTKPFNARHFQLDYARDNNQEFVYIDVFRQGRNGDRRELVTELRRVDARNPMRRASDRNKIFQFTDPTHDKLQSMGITKNTGELAHEQVFDILIVNNLAHPEKPMEKRMTTEKQYTLPELQQVYNQLRNREIELAGKLHGTKAPVVPIKGASPKFVDVDEAFHSIQRQASIVQGLLRRLAERDPNIKAAPDALDIERSKAVTNLTNSLLA